MISIPILAAATEPDTVDSSARCVLSDRLVDDLATSALLRARGLEGRDPLFLIAAVRLRMPAEIVCAELPGTSGASMLTEAATLAGDATPFDALIAQTRALQPRGSTTGMNARAIAVEPGAGFRLILRFKPRESAIVYAESSPGADILLTVTGAGGSMCQGRGPPGQQLCRFVPERVEVAHVDVVNRGGRATRVLLVTN